MSETPQPRRVRIALALGDPILADEIAAVLADAPGVILVNETEGADAVLVSPDSQADRREDEPLLTAREQQVLLLPAEGASNKAIAHALNISVHTAKFHVGQVIDKLDAIAQTSGNGVDLPRCIIDAEQMN